MNVTLYILYFLLIHLEILFGYDKEDKNFVTIDTSNGKLIGKKDYSKNVISFLGVPFAEPPVGKYRFRPSKPKRPWYPDSYKAFNYSVECLQSILFASEDGQRDEDCLYLNIWIPLSYKFSEPLPVLVWIYGGGFLHGSASRPEYDGHRLAQRDVIVVSCNYRVGSLGFLVSISDGLFGNYGLHDQKLALQWVQNNIQLFGGDPSRITVFGESAGAMSTVLHLFDQYGGFYRSNGNSNPLFNSIILQSNPLGYKYRSLAVANFIGASYKELLDCDDLRCLQSESADELLHVQDTLMAVPRSIGDFFTWGPVVTDSSYYREIRLRPNVVASNMTVQQPIETIKQLRYLNIPMTIGTTAHEGMVFVYTAFPTRLIKVLYQAIVVSFFREHAPKVLKMYSPLSQRIDRSPSPDYRIVLSQIIHDYLFRCPNQLFSYYAAKLGMLVYLYEFALPTRVPGFPCCDGLACHTAELPYVFDHLPIIAQSFSWIDHTNNHSTLSNTNTISTIALWLGMGDRAADQKLRRLRLDAKVARLMADYWTTFAKYGNPNGLLDVNGVVAGTRPHDAPWWPTLFGTLPSESAMNDMKQAALKRSQTIQSIQAMRSPKTKAKAPTIELYGDLAWDESYRTSRGGRGETYHETQDKNNANEKIGKTTQFDSVTENPIHPHPHPRYLSKESVMHKASVFSEYHDIDRHIHLLKFDAMTGVHILENEDCVCELWNKLNYKF